MKKSLLARIRARLKGESGQSTTEYILILAIVVMVASKIKKGLEGGVTKGVDNVSNFIDSTTSNIGNE
jgi:Flp pilus assembly pilin Flp